MTTFSTIASVAGGALSPTTVIVLGFANLIADGIAMGVGDFLSSKAELSFLESERAKRERAFARTPTALKAKVAAGLEAKGYLPADARELVDILATRPDFFVDYIMTEHEDMELPGEPWGPAMDGGVTFISFLIFGSMPMWVYVITMGVGYKSHGGNLGIAAAATVLSLALLGAIQGAVTKGNIARSAANLAVVGSLACAAAYGLSYGIMSAIGNGEEC